MLFRSEKDTNANDDILFQDLKKRKFILIFNLMLKVLGRVDILMKILQKEDINYSMLNFEIESIIQDLSNFSNK